jgi:DNA-binding FadR family transcriptional regulator
LRHLALERSLTDRTYEAILDAICDGELPAGNRINQDELARRLNVSRQPVVQALALLKVQGFVRDSGRRCAARQRRGQAVGPRFDRGWPGGLRLGIGQADGRGGHEVPPSAL